MSYIRTPEHRAMRSELIRRWRPWEKSTGPRSESGKKKSALRGFRGRERDVLREIGRVLKSQAKGLDSFK
jgi:hypothetical protein